MFIEERYEIEIKNSYFVFEFISTGKNGDVKKVVRYTKTELPNFYNLGFGDKSNFTNSLDDSVATDNGDTEKVLVTVASTIFTFTEQNPNAFILILSQDLARSRLYRMAISKFFEIISNDFVIRGLPYGDGTWEHFQLNKNYESFLIHRKTKLI